MADKIPTCRWGVITTGSIVQWFVEDLLLDRPDRKANHVVQAIGTSSIEKGQAFADKYLSKQSVKPKIYGSYDECYADPDVDCVYIGTPHAFHKRDCLAAIAAGKNILCEKAFTLNAKDAKEVLEAAKAEGVYLGEAMKLRHRPLCLELMRMLHEEKVIGNVFRMRSEFSLLVDIPSLPATSRYKDINLGAGSLLDIGIYPLTWAFMALDPKTPGESEMPKIMAIQSFEDGIEVTTSVILKYESTGRQAFVTSTTMANGDPNIIARIDGTNGSVEVEGPVASVPIAFTVYPKVEGDPNNTIQKPKGKRYEFEDSNVGQGFVWEADNTAVDIAEGRKESQHMPWRETVRVMEVLDEIRRQGGTVYPCD
jgi:predicted dehydrogenase